jgi:hypothetical protein
MDGSRAGVELRVAVPGQPEQLLTRHEELGDDEVPNVLNGLFNPIETNVNPSKSSQTQ